MVKGAYFSIFKVQASIGLHTYEYKHSFSCGAFIIDFLFLKDDIRLRIWLIYIFFHFASFFLLKVFEAFNT